MTIYDLCRWAGLPAEVEVFNLFCRLIPQEGLARFEKERQRQAVIPDFRIVVPVGGQPTSVLHELKCISISQSRVGISQVEYSEQWTRGQTSYTRST